MRKHILYIVFRKMSMHIRTSEGSVSGWTRDNVKTIDFLITVAGKYGREDESTRYREGTDRQTAPGIQRSQEASQRRS